MNAFKMYSQNENLFKKKGIFSLKLWSCIATKQITVRSGFVIQILCVFFVFFSNSFLKTLKMYTYVPLVF